MYRIKIDLGFLRLSFKRKPVILKIVKINSPFENLSINRILNIYSYY